MMRNLISHTPLSYLTSPPAAKCIERVGYSSYPLSEDVVSDLVISCLQNHDEVCGFVSTDQELFFVPNDHYDPHWNFHMVDDLVQPTLDEIVKVRNSRVLGMFHTHPNNVPWPSPVDIDGWPSRAAGWRYWIVTRHDVVEWRNNS